MSADTDDVKIASRSDFEHKRADDGELLPVTEPIPGRTEPCEACGGDGFTLEYPDADEDELDEDVEPERETCEVCDGFGERQVHIKVKPITQGEANEYLDEDISIEDMADEDIVEIIREFVVEPDFSDLESLDDLNAFGVTALLMTILNASGLDMMQGVVEGQGGGTPGVVEEIKGNSSGGS
jgi:hypothetical protein